MQEPEVSVLITVTTSSAQYLLVLNTSLAFAPRDHRLDIGSEAMPGDFIEGVTHPWKSVVTCGILSTWQDMDSSNHMHRYYLGPDLDPQDGYLLAPCSKFRVFVEYVDHSVSIPGHLHPLLVATLNPLPF